ncbi:Potassium channel subfamily K member 13 [Microtus ochrogaster]|uniref:Potassium channel subfamily K member 13 n=1 Tax=Microtus ochrogaster TaxID=79684 RepID=A0A8J6G2L3_MICOH|nr:Potassium channel subfamily K member 13 [Microtus ochrogaster]
MGVCCIYSLFNVISILIKQTVNWILRKLDSGYFPQCQRGLLRSRRNRMMPGNIRNRCNISTETDGMMESDTDGRRLSGEMISMKDTNKVSLAILQSSCLRWPMVDPTRPFHPPGMMSSQGVREPLQ